MKDQSFHQLVHGYQNGHSLLAASIDLQRNDLDLVSRLSDLSGGLGPNLEITPYLTFYPLPSESYFAIARTWPDESAPRAGCVITHTILVPLGNWAIAEDLFCISTLFTLPMRENIQYFDKSINSICNSVPHSLSTEPFRDIFTKRYFGENLSPIVWFGALDAESVAWCIIQSLWPSLRSTFACCTLALQPRTLGERPFDLVFAPQPAFSRFSNFPRDHIIDGQFSPIDSKLDPWQKQWSSYMFEGVSNKSSECIYRLSKNLDPHPSSIRSVFLFMEIGKRIHDSPTAALGALDLLEKLSPDALQAKEEKDDVAQAAINSIEKMNASDGLEIIYLLCQRLERPSFSLQSGLFSKINGFLWQFIDIGPEKAIKSISLLRKHHSEYTPREFMAGIAEALFRLLESDSITFSFLMEDAALVADSIAIKPSIAGLFLKRSGQLSRDKAVLFIVDCTRMSETTDNRAALRFSLIPEIINTSDIPLLKELLRDLDSKEILWICDSFEGNNAFNNQSLCSVFCALVGEKNPEMVRLWANSQKWNTFRSAILIATTFQPNSNGLKELLSCSNFDELHYSMILAAYIDNLCIFSLPEWLSYQIAQNSAFWGILLNGINNQEVVDVTGRIVRGLRRTAICRNSYADKLLGISSCKGIEKIQEHAIRQLILDYFERYCNTPILARWLCSNWSSSAFAEISARDLREIFLSCLNSTPDTWVMAWEFLESIPEEFLEKNYQAVLSIIAILLSFKTTLWSSAISIKWQHILSITSKNNIANNDFCSQALYFCFEHCDYPLGEVVALTFYPVHAAAMQDKSESWHLWKWRFSSWDKARDLRQSIVDSFLNSNWDPTQFILASRDPWLLKKLCKRMMRQWKGSEFLEKAYLQLEKNNTSNAKGLSVVLAKLLKEPDWHEDWD